jgi:hypothetical protein
LRDGLRATIALTWLLLGAPAWRNMMRTLCVWRIRASVAHGDASALQCEMAATRTTTTGIAASLDGAVALLA